MKTGGIDIGSRYIKYVLMENNSLLEVADIQKHYDNKEAKALGGTESFRGRE